MGYGLGLPGLYSKEAPLSQYWQGKALVHVLKSRIGKN